MNNRVEEWAIITGGNGGIGRSLCESFKDAGYSVIAVDKITNPHPNLKCDNYLKLDLNQFVNDTEYSSKMTFEISKISNNRIKTLVNNAAVQILGGIKELNRQQWFETMNVNFSAPFFLTQSLFRQLSNMSGSVINISSIHSTLSKKKFMAYATSKSALSALTRNMAIDFGSKVRVNAIEPAAIATEMLKAGFVGKEEQLKMLEAFHPLGRLGAPVEVAKLAVFLASEESGFLQGACISASGGIQSCLSDPSLKLNM